MRIYVLIALIVMIPAMSMASDYKISNVRVDVEADTAIAAREQAMTKARKNAFNTLMRRLGYTEDVTADDRTIATLVDSFEINREKLSNNRYLASVNIMFNEQAVRSYLPLYEQQRNAAQGAIVNSQNIMSAQSHRMTLRNSASYKMQIDIQNIQQWLRIKNDLNHIGYVQIDRLSTRRAFVTLFYKGAAGQLQGALNQKGWQLYHNTPQAINDAPYILMGNG